MLELIFKLTFIHKFYYYRFNLYSNNIYIYIYNKCKILYSKLFMIIQKFIIKLHVILLSATINWSKLNISILDFLKMLILTKQFKT